MALEGTCLTTGNCDAGCREMGDDMVNKYLIHVSKILDLILILI